jgi:cobalt-precorrin 5A hydrolase/precorrin-3B C17-methyltransferase
VPLLGGHHGANRLATKVAEALGSQAAVTTASDVSLGLALDDPPKGWRLADGTRVKAAVSALLGGARANVAVEAGEASWLTGRPWVSATGEVRVTVTDRAALLPQDGLVYRPSVLALGVGCERGTEPAELIELARASLAEVGVSPEAVACVVSLDLKADEVAVHDLARHLGVPARFFPVARLAEEKPRLANPSEAVFRATGCWGVAEGAALAAVGPDGALVLSKRRSARATCAIARSPRLLATNTIGVPRGRLSVVGIGPGAASWRTPEVTTALSRAKHLVGYGLYLDLLGELAAGKQRHQTGLGHETERARQALELAGAGEDVALVCSGDAGIYALATLVFELIDREDRPEWRRIELAVMPGISALQAAAARAGAPLGHDFCAISLSDLLTPWEAIEKRVRAAAEADFVVAFYNPRSERRTSQLVAALDMLRRHRPAETPVILARNLGRPDESITVLELQHMDVAQVDMLTLVMVGNSTTRHAKGTGWVYTPRGYAKKASS